MSEVSFHNIQDSDKQINGNLAKEETLSRRIIRGGFWVFFLRVTNRILGLGSTLVFARILAPADFGLFGISLLAMSALETFSQAGLNTALVQKDCDISPYLDIAWTFQMIRGGLLTLIIVATAPFVAYFFNAPTAIPIIQAIGLSTLIQGLNNIGVIYFDRELEFQKQYIYQLSGTLTNLAVAITAIIFLRTIWALIFGILAGNISQVIVSYLIHPYRPSIRFDAVQFKELFKFGKWILGSSILLYLVTQGDNIFVGKVLGMASLGFYQMAYRISNMPATEITHVISQVTFPAYSKLQTDISHLKDAYLKVLKFTAFLSFPVAGLIFEFALDFTNIFLGAKWTPMVPAMEILVFAGLLRSIAATAGYLFFALGKPFVDTIGQCFRLLILALLIHPLTIKYGILGTSLSVVASILITTVGFIYQAAKMSKCFIIDIIRMILFPFISITIIILLAEVIRYNLYLSSLCALVVLAPLCILSYLVFIYILDRLSNYGMFLLLRDQLYKAKYLG